MHAKATNNAATIRRMTASIPPMAPLPKVLPQIN
jgi:hypothetical protein